MMNEQEFRQRVVSLKETMYGLGLRMGLRPEDAADAVQEALIRLWRSRAGIPGEGRMLTAYCLRAFRNSALDVLKRCGDRESRQITLGEAASVKAPPERDAEYADTRSRIESLISGLPPGQRTAMRLSSFGGMSNDEIARATGQTEANVRQLLSRARRRLRDMIGD